MQTIVKDANTEKIVEEAKAEFLRAKGRVVKGLETTPDDKLTWSPSPTSRNMLEQVAHCAMSISGVQSMFQGQQFPWSDMQTADAEWRKMEKQYTTRESVTKLLDDACDGYVKFLDGITPEFLATNWTTPMGSFPMSSAITFMADHLRGHASQMDYMQTIYGDMSWHF
jgi:hypothetical protein